MKAVISKLNEIVGSWKFLALYFLTLFLITFIFQVKYYEDHISIFLAILIIAPLWGFEMMFNLIEWIGWDINILHASIIVYGIMVISLFYIAYKGRYRKIVAWIVLSYLTISLIRGIIIASSGPLWD